LTKLTFHANITIGLSKAPNTSNVILVEKIRVLWVEFNLTNKVTTYVKDEGANLNFRAQCFSLSLCCMNLCNYLNQLVALVLFIWCWKHVNILPMKLRLVWAWRKLAWKMPKLLFKKQSHGLKYLKKVNMNRRRFTMRLVCNIKS